MNINFEPMRWWQAPYFLSLNFQVVQTRDPLADRILANPWSLSSLLAYLQIFGGFFFTDNFHIVVDGERAGLLSAHTRPEFVFGLCLGLLPKFQHQGIGTQAMHFFEEHVQRQERTAWVGTSATSNKAILQLLEKFGGRSLGLCTATLVLKSPDSAPQHSAATNLIELSKAQARHTWRQWKLYEVEQIAGPGALPIATALLKWQRPPPGTCLALHQDGQEIGILCACPQKSSSKLNVDLLTCSTFWSNAPTIDLITTIIHHFGCAIHQLNLTQTHANQLTPSASFDFERIHEQERCLIFKQFQEIDPA
jgi:GNAT superfamily N-acetyltransferase